MYLKCSYSLHYFTNTAFCKFLDVAFAGIFSFAVLIKFFLLRMTIHTSGTTPPNVNIAPPIMRNQVKVLKPVLPINAALRANHKPFSVTVLNCQIPTGNRSRKTISSKPTLIDQNTVLIINGFHQPGLNNNRQQKSTAASERFPYTPINAA